MAVVRLIEKPGEQSLKCNSLTGKRNILSIYNFPCFLKHPAVYVTVKCVRTIFYLQHLYLSKDPVAVPGRMSCYALNVMHHITDQICMTLSQETFASVLFYSLGSWQEFLTLWSLKPVLLFILSQNMDECFRYRTLIVVEKECSMSNWCSMVGG